MPARSRAQQAAAAIARTHPERLHAKNRGMAAMSLTQLGHLASTPTKSLPAHAATGKTGRRR